MIVSMLGSIATHLIVPSLPNLQREFAADYSTVQLLVSVFIIAFGATQIVAGALADAYGRRRMLLIGLLTFAIASGLCTLASTIDTLIAMRVVQGASGCFGIVLARAIMRDLSSSQDASRMLGYLAVGTSVGPMLAPLLGGLLYEALGWPGPFWFMAVFSMTAFAFAYRIIPETAPSAAGLATLRNIPGDFAALLRRGSFLLNASNICINTAMFYSFIIGGSLIASRDLGLKPAEYGLWFSMVAFGYAAGNYLSGHIGRRRSSNWMILTGSILVAACILIMVWLHLEQFRTPLTLFLPMAGATLASGLVMPNSLAGGLSVDIAKTGSASGLLGFMQFAAAAVFSAIAGHLVEQSTLHLLLLMLGIGVAGIFSAAMLVFCRFDIRPL